MRKEKTTRKAKYLKMSLTEKDVDLLWNLLDTQLDTLNQLISKVEDETLESECLEHEINHASRMLLKMTVARECFQKEELCL